ncbi:MAG: Smr/MutS family protein [Pyrinomonadaceae bacterium]|nr:Smr/MutS family protein [Pyrinomonadaceae bacterium]
MNGDEVEVLVGVMRLREKIANIEVVVNEIEKPKEGKLEKLQKQAKASESNLDFDEENQNAELNIIGKRTDEAEDLLDKFLDKSYLSGFQKVRIVHGIGTGALKNFVHSFLKNHAHVSRYTLAHQTEGGNGATIVELAK